MKRKKENLVPGTQIYVSSDLAGTAETFTISSGGALSGYDFQLDGVMKGDINGDGNVNIADAILAFQVVLRIEPTETVYIEADVNGDRRIGIEEAIYVLQIVAGLTSDKFISVAP